MIEDMTIIMISVAVRVRNTTDEIASIEQGIRCCFWTSVAEIKLSIIQIEITVIFVIGSYLLISSRLASEAVMVALVDAAKRTDVNNFIFGFYFFYL